MIVKDVSSKKMNLSEISHGVEEVQFAFINPKTGKTVTPFCRCKDYFNDMFFTEDTGVKVDICGFVWNKGDAKDVLSGEKLTIAVRRRLRQDINQILDVKPEYVKTITSLLNIFEVVIGFDLSVAEVCDEGKNIIITYDRGWSEIPYLNSAYFFLVRLGHSYTPGEDVVPYFNKHTNFISPHDSMYWISALPKIKDMLSGKIDKSQTYNLYTQHSIHRSSGLIGYQKYKVN